jgi:hypothetical protein
MKRTTASKLQLHKNTVRLLSEISLGTIAGGMRSDTAWGGQCLTDRCSVNYGCSINRWCPTGATC